MADRASGRQISGIVFRKSGFWPLGACALPVVPGFPIPMVRVQLRPHFYCSEFLEKNSRKSDWQAHTGKARGQLRQPGSRAINDKGQVIWFVGCLSATVDP